MRRSDGLDTARAVAMMFVVATHAAISFMVTPIGWAVQDRSQNLGVDLYVWIVRAFAMPTFFWLSGYFSRVILDAKGVRGFVRHRVLRILLPLAIALVPVSFAVDALWDWGREVSVRGTVAADMPKFEGSELPVQLGHLWFLYYLLWLSLVGVLLSRVRVRVPDRAVIVVPAAITIGVLIGLGAMHTNTPLGFLPNLPILAFMGAYFAWGWLVCGRPAELARYATHAWRALAIAPIFLAGAIPCLATGTAPIWGIACAGLFGVASVTAFLGLCERYGRAHRTIQMASESSYWFYIAHLPLVVLLQIVLAPIAIPGILKYVVIVAITTIACIGTYALVRRIRR